MQQFVDHVGGVCFVVGFGEVDGVVVALRLAE